MPESLKHLELVRYIVDHIRRHFSAIRDIAILHDLPGYLGCDKPPKIGAYRPDVFAIDAPLTTTIVGEAKTQPDLENQHTCEQLISFLGFLRLQQNPVFIFAVPWQAKTTAHSLVQRLSRDVGPNIIQIAIIDDVENFK